MKLVHNWRQVHKMWSVWVITLLSVVPVVEEHFNYFSMLVPERYHAYVYAFFGVIGIIMRLIKQKGIDDVVED